MIVKLTKQDEKIITTVLEYPKEDLPYIRRALKTIKIFELTNSESSHTEHQISLQDVKLIIGNENFLSGLCRATFHSSACRETKDENIFIYFDNY